MLAAREVMPQRKEAATSSLVSTASRLQQQLLLLHLQAESLSDSQQRTNPVACNPIFICSRKPQVCQSNHRMQSWSVCGFRRTGIQPLSSEFRAFGSSQAQCPDPR